MAPASQKSRITLFFAIGLGLSVLMAGLKALIAWLADVYLYSAPWVGGFLRSIELAELSNWVVFAILGASLGAATLLLPRQWDNRAKLAILAALSPIAFFGSYMMQQHLWIQRVAQQANISYRDARTITNDYLDREVGTRGFFGFFPFSTQLAELPVRRESLESTRTVNPTQALTEELANLDDPRANFVGFLFARVGWLIRLMYMTIAGLTGLIYYFKGYMWAENRRRQEGGNGPSPLGNRPSKTGGGPASRRPKSKLSTPKSPSGKPPSGRPSSQKKPAAGKPTSNQSDFGQPGNQSPSNQSPKRPPNPPSPKRKKP